MSDFRLKPDAPLDVREILRDLEHYRPRRRGWTWRRPAPGLVLHGFAFRDASESLARSVPLPPAHHFGGIDPQPAPVITTEIASGRFEDDIRRMRMAAHHGADHIMVIRTAGQSHFDGLIEGTPQGVGGVPITRKQLRAQRKALDLIEDEVGRPINYHSYVSGVAGPEIAVLFAEEGVNGAHQDPQYNVIYRNINMVRSFVDACESKTVMAWAGMAQIDGAHNANATARDAWKVMPELMVQHAVNASFSLGCGMPRDLVCLSTVPPTAAPAPSLYMDLPYAVALRELFTGFRMRAQMNTKYIQSSVREATVTHVLNMLVSKLTSADIQSTITPDEGRNVPWHIYNVEACDTARQTFSGLDGLMEMVELKAAGPLREKARELKERAVLFMEELLENGGYFEGVAAGQFVDSGLYPERAGDGIRRAVDGGIGAGTVVLREKDYLAPVTAHYGYNNLSQYGLLEGEDPARLIGGCTFQKPELIRYIDELDETDNVSVRMAEHERLRQPGAEGIKPEMEWLGDGVVLLTMFFPAEARLAQAAALEAARRMKLREAEVISVEIMHPVDGTRVEVKARVPFEMDIAGLTLPKEPEVMGEDALREAFSARPMTVVCGTVGEDEHSVGLREIIDIKHGGIEKYGISVHYLGTSVPPEKLVNAAVELGAQAILASAVISHDNIHYKNIALVDRLAREMGVRDRLVFLAGGTQVTPELAREAGADEGFGRGTRGAHVATALARLREARDL